MAIQSNAYTLKIGKSAIQLICPSNEYAESLESYFRLPNSIEKPDITIKLSLIDSDQNESIPDSLFNGKNIIENEIHFPQKAGVCRIIGPNSLDLNVSGILTKGTLTRVFEQFLYQSYYSAVKRNKSKSVLWHSSCAIYQNKGMIFTGPSGSGKSTIIGLSEGLSILNDEISLIDFTEQPIMLYSTPFNGFFKEKTNDKAPLKAIFLLKHGKTNKITKINDKHIIKIIYREIVPPIGLEEIINPLTYLNMMDIAEYIFNNISFYELEFLPEKSIWKEIVKILEN